MAWKFRRWRIRWKPKKRKFIRFRRDRQKSREAHLRFRRNRGKMKQALRKARIKGKVTMRKNKAMGIYKKLAKARKRWKNILKSDVSMDMFMDNMLNEEKDTFTFTIETLEDLDGMVQILQHMKQNIEFEDEEETEEFEDFIDNAVERLKDIKQTGDPYDFDEDFLEDLVSFIEEYAEEGDVFDEDDKEYMEKRKDK